MFNIVKSPFLKTKITIFFRIILYIIWAYRIKYFIYPGYLSYTFRALKIKFLKKIGFLRLPKLFFCPSHICNANCSHCYEKYCHKDKAQSISTEDCKQIINQFTELGGYMIYFCSGEFLLREDALELIKYCHDRKIMTSLTTNGLLLDKKKIEDLKMVGLDVLNISLDSDIAEEHDRMRRVPGCFNKAVDGLRFAQEKGIRTQIWTYTSKTHHEKLGRIAKLAEKLKVECVYVFSIALAGHLFNKFEENLTVEERNKIRKKYLFQKPIVFEFPHEKIYAHCNGGGREHVCVMPSGDITFCGPVPYSYGNLNESSLKEILPRVEKDYKKFSKRLRGQCPVNFKEYREECSAEFLYDKKD